MGTPIGVLSKISGFVYCPFISKLIVQFSFGNSLIKHFPVWVQALSLSVKFDSSTTLFVIVWFRYTNEHVATSLCGITNYADQLGGDWLKPIGLQNEVIPARWADINCLDSMRKNPSKWKL